MSSSDLDSRIDFLDPPDAVQCKIKKAFCEEGKRRGQQRARLCWGHSHPHIGAPAQHVARKASNGGTSLDSGDEQKPP